VHGFSDRFIASGRSVDILLANAGVIASPLTRVGPGWESQFATNHLGHFALANLLWPALTSGGGRVISVSSRGHKASGIRWDDLQFERDYDKWKAYGQAKTANVLFAVQLDKLAAPHGVRAFSVYPGGIQTPLQRHLDHDEMVRLGWFDRDGNTSVDWKSPEHGASAVCTARTATSPRSTPAPAKARGGASARGRSTRIRRPGYGTSLHGLPDQRVRCGLTCPRARNCTQGPTGQ